MAQLCRRCQSGQIGGNCSKNNQTTFQTTDEELKNNNYSCFQERYLDISMNGSEYKDPLPDNQVAELKRLTLINRESKEHLYGESTK